MTKREKKIAKLLGWAWNEFVELEVMNDDDLREFRNAIHAAQNIVLARKAKREDTP